MSCRTCIRIYDPLQQQTLGLSATMKHSKAAACHSREGGNPVTYQGILDPRLRGGDMLRPYAIKPLGNALCNKSTFFALHGQCENAPMHRL